MNRATADNQSAQSEEEGLEPTKEWVKDLVDEIVAEEFASPDLELHWLDEDEGDPETVLEGRLKVGALTLNEMRDALGLDPFDNAAADRPMVLTATGFVPIEANASGEGASTSANGEDVKPNAAVVQKYSPDQPRVPAGNPDGGQWTSDGGNGSSTGSSDAAGVGSESPKRYAALDTGTLTDETKGGESTALAATDSSDDRVELAQVEVTPKGFSISRPPGGDPLDPKGLNGPILPDEQQKVADALALILNQDFSTLYPHVYQNYPHPRTGAVLPSSAAGYIVFDVPGLGKGRGVGRLVIDAGTGAIYYTNNHYLSFYPLKLNPRGG